MSHLHADCCPRCQGFVVEDILFDGSGWSNFHVRVRRCLMCARIFEKGKEGGGRVCFWGPANLAGVQLTGGPGATLEDAKCYGARPAGIGS